MKKKNFLQDDDLLMAFDHDSYFNLIKSTEILMKPTNKLEKVEKELKALFTKTSPYIVYAEQLPREIRISSISEVSKDDFKPDYFVKDGKMYEVCYMMNDDEAWKLKLKEEK